MKKALKLFAVALTVMVLAMGVIVYGTGTGIDPPPSGSITLIQNV